MDTPACQAPAFTAYPFDARGIARRFRHSAIFGALSALQPGEAMRFVNDHDPLPLLDQLRERFAARVEIVYRRHEPGAIVIGFNAVARVPVSPPPPAAPRPALAPAAADPAA